MSPIQPAKVTKRKSKRRGINLPKDAPLANPVEDEQDFLECLMFPKFGYVLPPHSSHRLLFSGLTFAILKAA